MFKESGIAVITEEKFEEIVAHIINEFPDADLPAFIQTKTEDLVMFHHTLGAYIRNRFDMWSYNYSAEIENGIDVSKNHPDAVSMACVREAHKRLVAGARNIPV